MAIRLTDVKVNSERVYGKRQVQIAKRIARILEEKGITAEVTISRYYADRWYSPEGILPLIERDEVPRELK